MNEFRHQHGEAKTGDRIAFHRQLPCRDIGRKARARRRLAKLTGFVDRINEQIHADDHKKDQTTEK